jgi:pectate lyase
MTTMHHGSQAAGLALVLAAWVALASCGSNDDGSAPTPAPSPPAPASLGADGFATVAADGSAYTVRGGDAADAAHTYTVTDRAGLVAALYGKPDADLAADPPDDTPKTILVRGTINLDSDAAGQPASPDADLQACTGAFTSAAAFYAAYKLEYDPNLWIRQSLDADNKPPALPRLGAGGSPSLEGIRHCAQQRQAARIVLRVGSNTSLLGLGGDARIINGSLRLGDSKVVAGPPDPVTGLPTPGPTDPVTGLALLEVFRPASNIVIRNIRFEDAYDAWPSWDPKDSFSIAAAELGTGQCAAVFDAAADTGPHQCPSRKGGRWNSEYDLIGIVNASQVWIDHNSFSDGARPDSLDPPVPEWAAPFNAPEQKVQHHDGAVDITNFAARITLSFNHFKDHDKTHLIGGSDTASRQAFVRNEVTTVVGNGPDRLAVTFHHNLYENATQRLPRVRFAQAHVFNNLFVGQAKPRSGSVPAATYAWSVGYTIGTASKLYVESNVYEISPGAPGDELPGAAKLIFGDTISSSVSNQNKCLAAGYRAADCDTYFFETGTLLNSAPVPEGSLLAAAQAKGGGSNAVVKLLDATYWTPASSYAYGADDVAAVAAKVRQQAGAGRL